MSVAIALLYQFGEEIIKGKFSAQTVQHICEKSLNKQEATDFAALLVPHLSPQSLHAFNAALLQYAHEQDAHIYMREARGNIVKQMLIAQARQQGLFRMSEADIAKKLLMRQPAADFYLAINISEVMKDHFANVVLPSIEQVEAYANADRSAKARDITARFYFNVINPVVIDVLMPLARADILAEESLEFELLMTNNMCSFSNQFNPSTGNNESPLKSMAELFMNHFFNEIEKYRDSKQHPQCAGVSEAEAQANWLALQSELRKKTSEASSDDDVSWPFNSAKSPLLIFTDRDTRDVCLLTYTALVGAYSDYHARMQRQYSALNHQFTLHTCTLPRKSKNAAVLAALHVMLHLFSTSDEVPVTLPVFMSAFDNLRTEMGAYLDGIEHSIIGRRSAEPMALNTLKATYSAFCIQIKGLIKEINKHASVAPVELAEGVLTVKHATVF